MKNKNTKKAIDLYKRRFDFRLPEIKGYGDGEHITTIINLTEQLNRMSDLILRDMIMF